MLILRAIVAVFRVLFATKADLAIENLSLRQQLDVLRCGRRFGLNITPWPGDSEAQPGTEWGVVVQRV